VLNRKEGLRAPQSATFIFVCKTGAAQIIL